jgi:hypothetical protein
MNDLQASPYNNTAIFIVIILIAVGIIILIVISVNSSNNSSIDDDDSGNGQNGNLDSVENGDVFDHFDGHTADSSDCESIKEDSQNCSNSKSTDSSDSDQTQDYSSASGLLNLDPVTGPFSSDDITGMGDLAMDRDDKHYKGGLYDSGDNSDHTITNPGLYSSDFSSTTEKSVMFDL